MTWEGAVTKMNADSEPDEHRAPWIRASIVIRDFGGSPEEISALLGLQPTRSGRAGEPRTNVLGVRTSQTLRQSYWSLHSIVGPRESLSSHVDDLTTRVAHSMAAFRRLPAGATVRLRCTVIPEGNLPLFSLSCSGMRVLAEIGAHLEIDIISVEGPPDEEEGHGIENVTGTGG
jgi:hypothetical protein